MTGLNAVREIVAEPLERLPKGGEVQPDRQGGAGEPDFCVFIRRGSCDNFACEE